MQPLLNPHLEKKLKRYGELEKLLTDPALAQDNARYQKIAKELSGLSAVVKKHQEIQRLLGHIEDTRQILATEKSAEMKAVAEAELEDLQRRRDLLTRELEELLIGEEGQTHRNVIVELRAGTGGQEASLFAADVFRMYSKYAVQRKWKCEVMDSHPTESGGLKEIIFSVEGEDAYQRLHFEAGVHRVQRVPATEASGRIHTSAITVAVLPQPEEIEVEIRPQDLRVDVFRSSGHGGQSVNTTDSAVRLTHLPTGIVVSCQDERSQLKNKNKAMKVLRARVLEKMTEEAAGKLSSQRRQMVGTGDRSEKIRTYNFPDRRVTDHRIGLTLHRLEAILEGDLDCLVSPLLDEEKRLKLLALAEEKN